MPLNISSAAEEIARAEQRAQALKDQQCNDAISFAIACSSQAVRVENQSTLIEADILEKNAAHQEIYINMSAEMSLATPSKSDITGDPATIDNTLSEINIKNENTQTQISFLTDTIMVDRQSAQPEASFLDSDAQASQNSQQNISGLLNMIVQLTQKINYTKQ